jgi:hypothetical protein
VIFGLISGRLQGLPHPALFISVFVFLPLPHHFAQVADDYMQSLRAWLALLAIVVCLDERMLKQIEDLGPIKKPERYQRSEAGLLAVCRLENARGAGRSRSTMPG